MVGRSNTVETLVAQLPQRRLITIIGAGGIGKTTVALAGAERLLTGANNVVVLPNSFLAKLGLTNISRPDERYLVTLIYASRQRACRPSSWT
jgi:hypothetical protein